MCGSGGWVVWYSKQNIKQEKLVFYPKICFPASKLNRLQRGRLFVLLHQAGLLNAGVRPKEHRAGSRAQDTNREGCQLNPLLLWSQGRSPPREA